MTQTTLLKEIERRAYRRTRVLLQGYMGIAMGAVVLAATCGFYGAIAGLALILACKLLLRWGLRRELALAVGQIATTFAVTGRVIEFAAPALHIIGRE